MVEYLVTGDLALAGGRQQFVRSSVSKLLTPQLRIFPALASSSNAATVSSSGYEPRQCNREQSSRSVFSRANERSHAVMVPRREALLGRTSETSTEASGLPPIASP